MKKLTFLERAAKLGHSAEHLKAGATVSSVITIPHVDALRDFLDDGSSPEERAARELQIFGSPAKSAEEAPGAEGILRRVHAYVFGNTPLCDHDRERLVQAFPMKVAAVSAPNQTYSGPTDLGTSLGLQVFNFGTLTMTNNAYVRIQNTPLQFTVDTYQRQGGGPPSGFGDFNIFGATGGAGATGPAGGTSTNGGTGSGGNCSSVGISGASGGPGGKGATGSTGTIGGAGNPGLASLYANITITTGITGTSNIVVLTRSGTGGVGGTGGAGATGGNGGKGGDGATCDCTGSSAGNGGNGGRGGNGGPGGPGGPGINAGGNVTVQVPSGFISSIIPMKLPAPGGAGGAGGGGGVGGNPGGGGSGGKHNGNGSAGATGGSGTAGATGTQNNQQGTPADILVQPY